MNWNPDDIVLIVEAYHEIQKAPGDEVGIVTALAEELNREITSVQAAIAAVRAPPLRSGVAHALCSGRSETDPPRRCETDPPQVGLPAYRLSTS